MHYGQRVRVKADHCLAAYSCRAWRRASSRRRNDILPNTLLDPVNEPVVEPVVWTKEWRQVYRSDHHENGRHYV